MELGISQRMAIHHKIPEPKPIFGLSGLELELLLDRSLQEVEGFYGANPDHKPQGNYFYHPGFAAACKGVRGSIRREDYLARPQVLVEEKGERFFAQYNPQLDESIQQKVARFKGQGGLQQGQFSHFFLRQWGWQREQQVAIGDLVCSIQAIYLGSKIPLDLQPFSLEDVGNSLGFCLSSAGRLVQSLTIQVPDGGVLFARALIPGASLSARQGVYALGELQKDAMYFSQGDWTVSAEELKDVLRARFSLDLARRTVAKYQGMLREQQG